MRITGRGLALVLGPLLAAAGSAAASREVGAQSAAPPAGSRVRIRHDPHPDRWLTGVLQPAGPDTVAIDNGRGRWVAVVPAAAVRRMEVSRGAESRREAATRGALWGGAIGAAGGAFAGAFSDTCRDTEADVTSCENESSRAARIAGGAAVGAVAGAVVGALVTRGRPRERWAPVPLPLRIGLGAPARGGVGPVATLSF